VDENKLPLSFLFGKFSLQITTFVFMAVGLYLVLKYPTEMKGLYIIGLGWFTYFTTKLLTPRPPAEAPKGE
jgi:hypothetical protein